MNIQTDTRRNGARTANTRLLLLVTEREPAAVLSEWVQRQSACEAVDATGQAVADTEFDGCVFDRAGFERYETELVEANRRSEPVALPSLLVLPERPGGTELDWATIEREFDGVVDDVLRRPLRPVDVAGTVDRALAFRRETEQHRHTRARLAQFERTVDAMKHALYVTDAEGTIEFVNPAFTAVTGYDAAEAVGERPAILRSGHHDDEYYRRLWTTISAGDVWSETVVNERKDGERYHAEQTIVPVTDDDGTIRNYVAVQTDVTERANRTQHLQVLDRILRHNLRNDMNVIQARAELLGDETTGPSRRHAETIQKKARDLVDTADKERDIVRLLLETQRRTDQDISRVARRSIRAVRREYPDADVDAAITDGVRASASPRLDRAIEELLVNGIVHNDTEQPTVELSVTERSDGVEIVVADDGPGIPETETAVLTGSESLDPLFHGSGLGLWLVYWIARFSQGTLSFAERRPRGSVVTLRLAGQAPGPDRLTPDDIHTPSIR